MPRKQSLDVTDAAQRKHWPYVVSLSETRWQRGLGESIAPAPVLRFNCQNIQLRLAQAVQVLAGTNEYLVAGCGRGG